MRTISYIAGFLLVVGGLNWLSVALFNVDFVAALFGLRFGETSTATRVVYGLVGLSALWELLSVRHIETRFEDDRSVRHA